METSKENTPGRGASGSKPLSSDLSAERQHAFSTGEPQHLYYEQGGRPPAHAMPAVQEGEVSPAVRASAYSENEKSSPSPPSGPTTGTTTTPTSVGGTSSGEAHSEAKAGPEFPQTLSSAIQPPQSVPEGESWQGHMPYATSPGSGEEPAPAAAASHSSSSAKYNPANYPAAIKLLVSNNVAGSIIGRAGQTISELQSQSNTRIKLSQSGDFYPGTQDRVCLVQGEPGPVKKALRLLLERLYMLQEHQHSQHMAWQLQKQKGAAAPAFDFVLRLLVPISSCGMIIGKSGSNIKFMEESTGVSSVRLSPKEMGDAFSPQPATPPTSERIVTVTGPGMECCLQCCFLIFDGMTSHPDICRYSNMTTSYSVSIPDIFGPPSRPVAAMVSPLGSSPARHHTSPEHQLWEGMQGTSPFSAPSPVGLQRRVVSSPDLPGVVLNQRPSRLLAEPSPQDPLLAGFSPGGVPAPGPSSYSLQMPQSSGPPGQQPMYLMPHHAAPGGPLVHSSSNLSEGLPGGDLGHSLSAPNLLAVQLEQSMHITPPAAPPPPMQTSSSLQDFSGAFVPQPPTMVAPGCFNAQVFVPDAMIGSILGRGGRTLNELQMLSGTRIRISQRGEYMPGTRSRIVNVRGQTAQAVWQAQYMMSQRMVLPPTASYPVAPPALRPEPPPPPYAAPPPVQQAIPSMERSGSHSSSSNINKSDPPSPAS